jgi:hypothetical protein
MSTVVDDELESQDEGQQPVSDEDRPQLIGLLAEFDSVDAVVNAARGVRKARYRRWDVHSPFPIHGIDYAIGIKPTILPWLVLGGGLFGLVGGLLLQWYTNAFDYPFLVSGKPIWSLPANIPVIFECTILCASLVAVFGMFGLNKLPTLYNPLFKSERFRRVTSDRFFIVIDSSDPMFDETITAETLKQLGAKVIERVED